MGMHLNNELTLIIILLVICLAGLLSQRLKFAPAVSFLFAGIVLGLMPEFHNIYLKPSLILVIFLPPILMEAAFFTSLRDFKANIAPILLLSIGLVILTAFSVAYVFKQLVPGANMLYGLLLGVIISPPDVVAVSAMLKKFNLPRRLVSIIEGESLVNDATTLILYRFTLAAILTDNFSTAEVASRFIYMASVGTLIGLIIGFGFVKFFPKVREPSVEILSTFIPPYGAYLIAESFNASSVLAVVSTGLIIGWNAPRIFSGRFRMPAESFWRTTVFLFNCLIFMLIGVQLPSIISHLQEYDKEWLAQLVGGVCLAIVAIRFLFSYIFAYGSWILLPTRKRKMIPTPSWKPIFLGSWISMRGIVSLSLALAVPFSIANSEPFPYRDLILFVTFCVILFTVVFQGLLIPLLLRWLDMGHDSTFQSELWYARRQTALAAIKMLEEQEESPENLRIYPHTLGRIKSHYYDKLIALADGPFKNSGKNDRMEHPLIESENFLWQQALKAERETVINMRDNFQISDEVMHKIMREIDLLAARFVR